MKTTEEQRAELRRLADNHSVLKWPELINLLDDFSALEAENARRQKYDNIECACCQATIWCHSPEQLAYCQQQLIQRPSQVVGFLQDQVEILKEKIAKLEAENERLQARRLDANQDLITVENERDALKEQIARLTAPLEAIIRRVALISPYYEMAREALTPIAARASKEEEKT